MTNKSAEKTKNSLCIKLIVIFLFLLYFSIPKSKYLSTVVDKVVDK